MPKTAIRNLDSKQLEEWLAAHDQPAFRSQQLGNWLYNKWIVEFDEMRNIPKALREQLAHDFMACSLSLVETQSDAEGTTKFLYRLADGETIESVLIQAPGRQTVCVSTQVGCPVRCAFCASGRHGLVRNLEVAEIVDQVVMACRNLGDKVTNVVIMGMGEPLLNYENLAPALKRINAPDGLEIGARRITVSTSGIPDGIRRLAEDENQWTLALSLHATRETQRARLIPAPYRFPLKEIFDACRFYHEKTGRMITIEYTLLRGRNSSSEDAERLADIARGLRAKVNLIPYNATVSSHQAPLASEVQRFQEILDGRGITTTVRLEKGSEIQAACGQLRHQHESGPRTTHEV